MEYEDQQLESPLQQINQSQHHTQVSILSSQKIQNQLNYDTAQSYTQISNWAQGQLSNELNYQTKIIIKIDGYLIGGSKLNKYVVYKLRIQDSQGQRQILRRYSDFDKLQQKLIERWPGHFIPSIHNKVLTNNLDQKTINIRIKFLNNFLRKVSSFEYIYNGEEFQIFLNSSQKSLQTNLQNLKQPKYSEIYQKYSKIFPQLEQSINEDQCNQVIQFESVLRYFKVALSNYKRSLRQLAQAKQKYNQGQKKLMMKIMPQYEEICYGWWHPQIQQQIHQQLIVHYFQRLMHIQLKQMTEHLWNQNPFWIYYDIMKFQVKQIDVLLRIIEECKKIRGEKKYLERTITINQEQLKLLSQNKKTLKTFFMGGSSSSKKQKLTKETQQCQAHLQEINKLFNIIIHLAKISFHNFKLERGEFYRKSMAKASKQQLKLITLLMSIYSKIIE